MLMVEFKSYAMLITDRAWLKKKNISILGSIWKLFKRHIGSFITQVTLLCSPHYTSGRPDFGLRAGHVQWWFYSPRCGGSSKNIDSYMDLNGALYI